MGDTTATPQADAPETEATPTPTPDAAQQPTKTEVPPEVAAALKKANKEAETLRLKLKAIEDRDLSETEKLTARLTEAEKRAEKAEKASLRFRVGNAKGLPARLTERLQGDTEEEMAADADALLAEMKPRKGGGDWDAGTRTPAPPATDMNATLRRMAGRGA